jgi:hypothetical protein
MAEIAREAEDGFIERGGAFHVGNMEGDVIDPLEHGGLHA